MPKKSITKKNRKGLKIKNKSKSKSRSRKVQKRVKRKKMRKSRKKQRGGMNAFGFSTEANHGGDDGLNDVNFNDINMGTFELKPTVVAKREKAAEVARVTQAAERVRVEREEIAERERVAIAKRERVAQEAERVRVERERLERERAEIEAEAVREREERERVAQEAERVRVERKQAEIEKRVEESISKLKKVNGHINKFTIIKHREKESKIYDINHKKEEKYSDLKDEILEDFLYKKTYSKTDNKGDRVSIDFNYYKRLYFFAFPLGGQKYRIDLVFEEEDLVIINEEKLGWLAKYYRRKHNKKNYPYFTIHLELKIEQNQTFLETPETKFGDIWKINDNYYLVDQNLQPSRICIKLNFNQKINVSNYIFKIYPKDYVEQIKHISNGENINSENISLSKFVKSLEELLELLYVNNFG